MKSITGALGHPGWTQVHVGLKHVTTSVNYLWGVNSNDDIYRCASPCTGEWIHVPGKLEQIDAGDMEVSGVNSTRLMRSTKDRLIVVVTGFEYLDT